jgi:hypothetical protein
MWHALRAELAYSRPWLFGGLGIAAGVAILLEIVFYAIGEEGPPSATAAGLRGMFLVMAPMIVGFIAQAYRHEERRTRLLMAGPLTPRQIAGVAVLLPTVLSAAGVLAAMLVMGTAALLGGELSLESVHLAGYVGGMMFMMLMMGLLAQEAAAARRQGRSRATAIASAGFVAAVLLLAGLSLASILLQGELTWPSLHLANLIVALAAMLGSVALYEGRNDFTR